MTSPAFPPKKGIDIPLESGLNLHRNEYVLPPGEIITAKNLQIYKDGTFSKRKGYSNFSLVSLFPTYTLAGFYKWVGTRDKILGLCGPQSDCFHAAKRGAGFTDVRWINPQYGTGIPYPLQTTIKPVVGQPRAAYRVVDSTTITINSIQYTVVAWITGDTGAPTYCVLDSEGNCLFQGNGAQTASTVEGIRVIRPSGTSSNVHIIYHRDATQNIDVLVLDVSTGAPATLVTPINTAIANFAHFDAMATPTTLAANYGTTIVWKHETGVAGKDLHATMIDTAGAVIRTGQVSNEGIGHYIACCPASTLTSNPCETMVAQYNGDGLAVPGSDLNINAVGFTGALANAWGPANYFAGGAGSGIRAITSAPISTSRHILLVEHLHPTAAPLTHDDLRHCTTTQKVDRVGAAIPGPHTIYKLGILARPFVISGSDRIYMPMASGYELDNTALGSFYQGTGFLVEENRPGVVSRFMYSTCGYCGLTAQDHLPYTRAHGSTWSPYSGGATYACVELTALVSNDLENMLEGAENCSAKWRPVLVTHNFNDRLGFAVEFQESLYTNQGMLWQFDGSSCVEAGFHQIPLHLDAGAEHGAAGHLAAGTYKWVCTWSWMDKHGNEHESGVSNIASLAVAGPASSVDVYVPTMPYCATNRNIKLRLYRTVAGGSDFYFESEVENVTTAGYVMIASGTYITDAQLILRKRLYTDLGEIEHEPPPEVQSIGVAGGRLWALANDKEVYYSSLPDPGAAAFWSSLFGFKMDNNGCGRLACVGGYGNNIIIAQEYGVSRLFGDGPNNFGVGSYPLPEKILDQVGAIYRTQPVSHPGGFIFNGPQGIWEIGSNGVRNIGKAVEALCVDGGLFQYPVSSVLCANRKQIAMCPYAHNPGEGEDIYIYNFAEGKNSELGDTSSWMLWDLYYLARDLIPYVFDPKLGHEFSFLKDPGDDPAMFGVGYSDEGASIPIILETGWISLAGLGGVQRLESVEVTLKNHDTTQTLQVRIYIYFEDGTNQYVNHIAPASVAGSTPYTVRIRPSKQSNRAIKIKITEDSVPAAYPQLTIYGIRLLLGAEEKQLLGASQSY